MLGSPVSNESMCLVNWNEIHFTGVWRVRTERHLAQAHFRRNVPARGTSGSQGINSSGITAAANWIPKSKSFEYFAKIVSTVRPDNLNSYSSSLGCH